MACDLKFFDFGLTLDGESDDQLGISKFDILRIHGNKVLIEPWYILTLRFRRLGRRNYRLMMAKKSKIFEIFVERNFKSGDYLEFLSHETEFFANVRFEPSFGTV